MGTLKNKAYTIMQNSDSNLSRSQSSQGSIVSTTSNLLKQNQDNNSFDHLEADAQRERNRLSSMLDSYKNNSDITQSTNDAESFTDADDFIVNRRSLDGHQRDFIVPVRKTPSRSENDHFEFENAQPDSATPKIPATTKLSPSLNIQSDFPSPSSQRRSMYSDYAPSIHEVNKVAYVVDPEYNDDDHDDDDVKEVSPVEDGFKIPNVQRKASVIKISRSSSQKSGNVLTPEHIKNKESVASYNSVAQSGSGSSKYPESTYSTTKGSTIDDDATIERQASIHPAHPDQQNNPYSSSKDGRIPEESESTSSFEFNIGPLKTTKESQSPIAVDRSHVTSVEPAIPSRSKRRPASQAFIKAPINKLKLESQANRPRSVDLGEMDSLMSELNKEIYNSPSAQKNPSQESGLSGFQSAQEHSHERHDSNTDSIKSGGDPATKRPLPPPPVPKHEKKPSVTYDEPLEQQRSISQAHDDGFVTEDEEDTKKELKKKHKKKHKKRSSSNSFKKGHFNHETLTQLLQVTEGTIIGQEFQNIGLESTEKQLLERLVDSLSRLTADMVIDSERHDESVKRLNKAIKALEGF